MNKNSIIKGMIWRFAERCGSQGINFIVSILLARVLTPDEYGTVALVTVFISILQVFVNSGFPNALIQKKNSDDLDFSTVFYFNMFTCVFVYIILFFCAPLIASFYNDLTLVSLIRVLGVRLIIAGLLSVQQASIRKKMQFKKFFYSTILGTVLSGVVGLAMVYNGFGVWALIGQTLTAVLVNAIVLWFTSGFIPKLMFSFTRLKSLFSYGWKILITDLIETLYGNLRSLIIGKGYTSEDLAYYNKGNQFPAFVTNNLNMTIDSVLFPAMSKVQDQISSLKNLTRKSIKTSGYIVWPCMVGLFVCADSLTIVLLTEKWLPMVPYLRLFCLYYALKPIQTANLNAIKALGKSDVILKLQIIKKIIGLVSILATFNYGVLAIAIAATITAPIEMILNSYPNKKFINYSYKEQIKDILPYIIMSSVMGVGVWFVSFINLSIFIVLFLQIVVGVVIYILLSILFKIDSFNNILDIVKSFKFKK